MQIAFAAKLDEMGKLILPKTITIPSKEELPQNAHHLERWMQSFDANIVEGYRLFPPDGGQLFSFTVKVNVDNPRLWEVFEALSRLLPEPVCALYGWVESEVGFSKYMDYNALWNAVAPLEKYIVEDGYLQFGLLNHTETELVEVFVAEAKYIQFWGIDLESFEKVMDQFGLPHVHDLAFIDEYPMVTHSLDSLDADAPTTREVVTMLEVMLQ